MKLLILTQKVDKDDDILGFFHNWLVAFAGTFEKITVVCLFKGEYDLPRNVTVVSLGKEKGVSKLKYVLNFFRHIWKYRTEYDAVFVHMNAEYLVLGGPVWKMLRKKVYLWYNHKKGSVYLRFGHIFAKKIFSTSTFAYPTRYAKTLLMPAGIDTELFRDLHKERKANDILFLGRLSPVKHLEDLDPALRLLKQEEVAFTADVYGDPPPQDKEYAAKWKQSVSDLIDSGHMILKNGVPNYETPDLYNTHQVYVNLTPSGSLDKTILEAMACGTIPIVVNLSFEGILSQDQICEEGNSDELAKAIKRVFGLSEDEKNKMRQQAFDYVKREHSLEALLQRICIAIDPPLDSKNT